MCVSHCCVLPFPRHHVPLVAPDGRAFPSSFTSKASFPLLTKSRGHAQHPNTTTSSTFPHNIEFIQVYTHILVLLVLLSFVDVASGALLPRRRTTSLIQKKAWHLHMSSMTSYWPSASPSGCTLIGVMMACVECSGRCSGTCGQAGD